MTCDTDSSHGSPAGRQARHMDTCGGAALDWTWRLRPALRLLFFFGERLSIMRTARPDSGHVVGRPYGLPTPCPESMSRSAWVDAWVERLSDACLHPRVWRRRTMTPPFILGFQPPFTAGTARQAAAHPE